MALIFLLSELRIATTLNLSWRLERGEKMFGFIEIVTVNDRSALLNIDQIIDVIENSDGSANIYTGMDGSYFTVSDYVQVADRIQSRTAFVLENLRTGKRW